LDSAQAPTVPADSAQALAASVPVDSDCPARAAASDPEASDPEASDLDWWDRAQVEADHPVLALAPASYLAADRVAAR